jgi:alkylation response protein AidB-like acyl-CoA dehydrogenase
MAGMKIWALAWTEKGSRYDLANVATTARREGKNYVLSGTKTAVIAAPWADNLIVSARTSGGPHDRGGVSLFVVDRHSANLDLQSFKTIDGRRAAEDQLMRGRQGSQLLGTEGEGVAALEACRDRAIGALCAEAVGAMAELNAATLEYSQDPKAVRLDDRLLPGAAASDGRYVHRASGGALADAASQSQPRRRGAGRSRGSRPAPSRRSAMPAGSSPTRRCSSTAAWA